MKPQQEGIIEKIYVNILGFALAFVFLTLAVIFKDVVWRLLCFFAKLAVSGLRKLLQKRAPAPSVPAIELPTPDIFKGATNLAPAKQLRF